jgi:hypothetical protein
MSRNHEHIQFLSTEIKQSSREVQREVQREVKQSIVGDAERPHNANGTV